MAAEPTATAAIAAPDESTGATTPAVADVSAPARVADKPQAAVTPAKARKPTAKTVPIAPAAVVAPVLAQGLVHIAISPWGQVEVNGAPAGTAPPLTRLELPQGTHTITIRNEDFPPYTQRVQVDPERPVTLKHRFGS